jgi:hypothetical protein
MYHRHGLGRSCHDGARQRHATTSSSVTDALVRVGPVRRAYAVSRRRVPSAGCVMSVQTDDTPGHETPGEAPQPMSTAEIAPVSHLAASASNSHAAVPEPSADDFTDGWLISTWSGSKYFIGLDCAGVWRIGGLNVPSPFSCAVPPQLWRIEPPRPWPPVLSALLWLVAARDLAFTDPACVPGGGKRTSAVQIVQQLPIRAAVQHGDGVIITGGIWSSPSVDEAPSCELARWRVIEFHGERHFVGWCLSQRKGRVSSRIRGLDLAARRGVTASGRVYTLVGPAGRDPDAEYVLERWLQLQSVSPDDVRDVTCWLLSTETESD